MTHNIICFDTESAQGRFGREYIEELIEISIIDASANHIYSHRFKPSRLKKWDTAVHHITPAMLAGEPHVTSEKPHLQKIFDQAKYIIGFSLPDDFKALRKADITVGEDKVCVELRHIYWYLIGQHNSVDFYSGPGLSACANELNVEIDASAVHTAGGDALVTLNLFNALYRLFVKQEGLVEETDTDSENFTHHIDLLLNKVTEAKYDYDRRKAAGFIHVMSDPAGGYRFIPTEGHAPRDKDVEDGMVCISTIAVKARRRAIYELETQYVKRRSKTNRKVFMLTPKDLKNIVDYANEFDNQEQMYQKLTGLNRGGIL